jgi:ubiquinone biosynthesis protein
VQLFRASRRFNVEIQPQLVLLQKTLLNIEGLGRQLYPELDLWQTAKPYLERWMEGQLGPNAFFARMEQEAPYWVSVIPRLPRLIEDRLLDRDGSDALRVRVVELADANRTLKRVLSGTIALVCALAVVIVVALLRGGLR